VGRCGLVVLDAEVASGDRRSPVVVPAGARTLESVVRLAKPHAAVLSRLLGDALIVDTPDAARALARQLSVPVATLTGEVFRGAWLVEGGARLDARGILETRGEMLALREQVGSGSLAIARLSDQSSELDAAIGRAEAAVSARIEDQHHQEKDIVGLDAQTLRATEDLARLTRRLEVVVTEGRSASEEQHTAEQRRDEAVLAITLHETEQRGSEDRMGDVLARLQAAREEAEARVRLVTEARAEQAALVERASTLHLEAGRLEEAARELDDRIAGREREIARTEVRRQELAQAIRDGESLLDANVRALDALKQDVRVLDQRVSALRADFGAREHDIRGARQVVEAVRTAVLQAEVARATAVSDLSHLAAVCLEAVNATIEDVVTEVARMDEAGELIAPRKRLAAASKADADEDEAGEEGEEGEADAAAVEAETSDADGDAGLALGPDGIIVDLKRKIDRLGPVNMMAIDQFDELEARHTFLTTQRKDLLDSIAQTGEAIQKIDKTTKERFEEAFAVVNRHFEGTFTTLFGGGRAGLVLIDQENDAESGIDIIAQPPGKRLQNVQLLSGGEKALTAMALMFAIFKYRPSPFCLLDEIDAPLDDANIGRFVEMLQSMQAHTQFILITHNRKTMEIADRLYGVTMEEPGVSKLISVQMN
jgi:chromosome segregation protein